MPEATLFKLDGYESSLKSLKDYSQLVLKESAEAVLSKSEFQKDREKWVVAMTCIGMRDLTGKYWFIKPATAGEQTPDYRAAAFDQIENQKYLIWKEVEIEVVFCPENVMAGASDLEKAFFEHLNEKKFSKAYPKNFVLLVYASFNAKGFSLDRLHQMIFERKPDLSEIWCLMCINQELGKYLLVKLFQDRQEVEIDFLDTLQKVINIK